MAAAAHGSKHTAVLHGGPGGNREMHYPERAVEDFRKRCFALRTEIASLRDILPTKAIFCLLKR